MSAYCGHPSQFNIMALTVEEWSQIAANALMDFEAEIDKRLRTTITADPIANTYKISRVGLPLTAVQALILKYRAGGWTLSSTPEFYVFDHKENLAKLSDIKMPVHGEETNLQARSIKLDRSINASSV